MLTGLKAPAMTAEKILVLGPARLRAELIRGRCTIAFDGRSEDLQPCALRVRPYLDELKIGDTRAFSAVFCHVK